MKAGKISREEIKEKVVNSSCGILATAIDVALYVIFQQGNLLAEGYGSRAAHRAVEKSVDEVLNYGISGETIKKAIWKAIHRGYIKRNSADKRILEITSEGKSRLGLLLPVYRKERPWDKRLFLITYDIPEKASNKRRVLREFLRKTGCGMLQASVWLSLYNPKTALKELVAGHHLPGSIIISDLGKDGSVGEEDLDDLMVKIFHLQSLNSRYDTFIHQLKQEKLGKTQINFRYLAILKDDPQLPFEILPYDWLGDKAYRYLQEYILS